MKTNKISEQGIISALSELFSGFGYLPFKMNKFEEYDFYVKNKDFLVSNEFIVFTDTNGKLMALKPDITLSIIKNSSYAPKFKQRVYYNENVFRVSKSSSSFKELIQSGVECIGDVDLFDIAQSIDMSLCALSLFGVNFTLDISHMGIVSSVLQQATGNKELQNELLRCLSEKNSHEIPLLAKKYAVEEGKLAQFVKLINLYGKPAEVIKSLEEFQLAPEGQAALEEIKSVFALLEESEHFGAIRIDFSQANSMKYYNGFVFCGMLEGISDNVLLGGQYDNLISRMGKKGRSIGFALYLDAAETLFGSKEDFDVDVLLLYDEKTDIFKLNAKMKELKSSGLKVSTQFEESGNLTFEKMIDMRGLC